MTIITNKEYSANPAKYMQRVKEGEKVVISCKGIYTVLNYITDDSKVAKEHKEALSLLAVASKGKQEKPHIVLRSHEDIDRYFESM